MTEDSGQRALQEVAAVRGEVSVLHEAVARTASRQDSFAAARDADNRRGEDERRASRRFTITSGVAATGVTLAAIGLYINSLS